MNTVGINQSTQTFLATSNGLASGNHILEAVEHALCEVIERDAHALTSARSVEDSLSAKIDIDTITDPSLREMIDACRAAEIDVAIFEMRVPTSAFLPSVRAFSTTEKGQWSRLGAEWGAGTHLSATVAMSRAITEAAQARLTVIAGSRDDNPPGSYAASQGVWTAGP